jgi:hypothetical protein
VLSSTISTCLLAGGLLSYSVCVPLVQQGEAGEAQSIFSCQRTHPAADSTLAKRDAASHRPALIALTHM